MITDDGSSPAPAVTQVDDSLHHDDSDHHSESRLLMIMMMIRVRVTSHRRFIDSESEPGRTDNCDVPSEFKLAPIQSALAASPSHGPPSRPAALGRAMPAMRTGPIEIFALIH
jgi:hypothetical protein